SAPKYCPGTSTPRPPAPTGAVESIRPSIDTLPFHYLERCARRPQGCQGITLYRRGDGRPPLPEGEAARSAGEGGVRAETFVLVSTPHPSPLPEGEGVFCYWTMTLPI